MLYNTEIILHGHDKNIWALLQCTCYPLAFTLDDCNILFPQIFHPDDGIEFVDKKSANVSLTIHVDDENDNPPSFVQMVILPDQGIYVSKDTSPNTLDPTNTSKLGGTEYRSPLLYVPENVTIGSPIIRLVARDPDDGRNAEITYNILGERGGPEPKRKSAVKRYFVMDSRSGEISVAGTLPAETDIVLEIGARDNGGLMDNVTVRVHVFDVNDNAPVFRQSWFSFDVPEGVYKRFEIGRIEATDADYGPNANVTYDLVPTSPYKNVKFDISRYFDVFCFCKFFTILELNMDD